MLKLNLPEYNFSFSKTKAKLKIFDAVRKQYVALTPEEWVRQNFLRFLMSKKKVPASHIAIEAKIKVGQTTKRFDAVVYNQKMTPAILMEFKAPDILLNENAYEQINIYNISVGAYCLIISNGIEHLCFLLNKTGHKKIAINNLPLYTEL